MKLTNIINKCYEHNKLHKCYENNKFYKYLETKKLYILFFTYSEEEFSFLFHDIRFEKTC